MCGIICSIAKNTNSEEVMVLKTNVQNRGPDFFGEWLTCLQYEWKGYFGSSILHTQGRFMSKQPFVSHDGSVLLWNGDIFSRAFNAEDDDVSDTQILSNWLHQNDGDVMKLVTLIKGPYAFIYFNEKRKRFWFARDPLGRRSLLWKISNKQILLTSVGHKGVPGLEEIPALGVFSVHFMENCYELRFNPWSHWQLCSASYDFGSLPVEIDVPIPFFYFENDREITSELKEPFFTHPGSATTAEIMDDLFRNSFCEILVNQFLKLLTESCRKRVTTRRNICKNCEEECSCSSEHTKIGILFSGGLDSTVIACLADKFVPENEPIDLLNVAFSRNGSFAVPDRNTGLSSVNELRSVCPYRRWNFVEINVTEEELSAARENRICHLVFPLNTVLDESLGCALWFACQAKGAVNDIPYTSSAKILLLGTGADEQLGGYMRHRNLLKRNGWDALQTQLLKETLEISKRNLGRDDRIACDSGRQPRFPFLDEMFVEYVSKLSPWQKCDPVLFPPGLGDKLILRLAAVKLGLKQCATFPKRAFQFGCRIAKSKEKGDCRSERL